MLPALAVADLSPLGAAARRSLASLRPVPGVPAAVRRGRAEMGTPWNVAARKCLDLMSAKRPHFCARGRQQDASELLEFLLDELAEEVGPRTFAMHVAETNVCACGVQSQGLAEHHLLQLKFPAGASAADSYAIQDLLRDFLATQERDLRCETAPPRNGCGAARQRCAGAWLSAPQLLVLHACRFETVRDAHGMPVLPFRKKKVDARLKEAEEIRISTPRLQCYDLVAMVEHQGASVDRGHYVCHAQVGGRWRTFDDAAVRGMRPSVADAARQAYLLFYAKRGS